MVLTPVAHTILIIDDETNLRHTLALILQREGYSVTTAGSATEAIQALQAGAFDLAFLDLKMPDIDGIQVLPDIRQLYPEMPVLILTAHATLDSAIEAVRQGARDYLLKPIDPPQILERVKEIIEETNQARRRRQIMEEFKELLAELHHIQTKEPVPTPTVNSNTNDPARFLQRGPIALDLLTRHATLGDRALSLSPTAFDYLATLIRHSPDPVTYETLVMESQGYKPNSIEARDMARWRIHELRKALEQDSRQPEYIITIRSIGYRLVV